MKLSNRTSIMSAFCMSLALSLNAWAQWDKKPYTEWSEKEVMKLLNDSAWGQTQTYTDTSRMFDRGRRADSSETRVAEVTDVNFRIRFLSAKPIRQAISRYMEIKQNNELSDQLAAKLKAFATADFPDYIVITVDVDSSRPSKDLQAATATLHKLTTAELKNNTYLLTKGGQRLFLSEYQSPRPDGLGARFIFPRLVEGRPYLSEASGEVQFYSELNSQFVPDNRNERKPLYLNMRYKVKDMMYGGKLEY